MSTTCKRLMLSTEVKGHNQYGEYTYLVTHPAKIRDEIREGAELVEAGPGLHLCGGQIVASVELDCDCHDSYIDELKITYVCDLCKRPADKDSVGIAHWPDDQYELETWLNQLLRDR